MANEFYCTTFCNKAHRLSDGKPLEHECYIIPPRLLKLERAAECCTEGECAEAWSQWSNGPRRTHRGIKERKK